MVDPSLLPLLRCPRCRDVRCFDNPRQPRCRSCGLAVPVAQKGYLDLLDVEHRGEPTAASAEQRMHESALVARLYDRAFRPAFVRALAGRGAGAAVGGIAGELFIHKQSLALDQRPGPWLDLSCGTGAFTRALATAASSALVVGLDISKAMLEVAAVRTKAYSNAVLVRGDAHLLPFADGSFDGINNASALHAYDDPEQVFREIWRVLKPDGLYVGSTYAEAPSLAGRLAARAAGIRRFEPNELRTWLSRLGFADFEELRLGGAFVFRARRP